MTAGKEAPSGPPRRRRGRWIVGVGLLLVGAWFLVPESCREEEKQLRTDLREVVKERFPEEAAAFSRTIGLSPYEPEGVSSAADRGAVVLVHGLDDPGKVWRSLAPALRNEGFDVWLMKYPNDQPIAESAALLFEELKGLGRGEVEQVSLVGHSMGGLVSRELLTSPEIAYASSAREGMVPEVRTLVLVATPNHGSPLARFRAVMEVRDQAARVSKGEASWLSGILDGAGEAGIDLEPGSRFLTELNARPHPRDVGMLSIAGVVGPWIDGPLADGLGDGLVSVESTRLAGVEHRTVEGTHLTIVRNLTEDSERIPPAVPIIVDRLKRSGP